MLNIIEKERLPKPLTPGKNSWCEGFRVFANDTSSGRPWCWYSPTLDTAQHLAKSLCQHTGQRVEICKYVGSVDLVLPPTEYIPSSDYTPAPDSKN